MKSLSFDDGRKSFMVNDDPSRVIRFNPADPEIINRLLEMKKEFEEYQVPEGIELNPDGTPKNDVEVAGTYVRIFTEKMREAFNQVFNADVYDTIFDGQSPLCMPGGRYLFEGVIEGMVEIMKPAFEEYQEGNKKRMDKYLGDL